MKTGLGKVKESPPASKRPRPSCSSNFKESDVEEVPIKKPEIEIIDLEEMPIVKSEPRRHTAPPLVDTVAPFADDSDMEDLLNL